MALKEQRNKANRTQKQMAEELGISQSAYSRWEKDPDGLDGYQLADLAKILGCSARDLRTDSAKAVIKNAQDHLEELADEPRVVKHVMPVGTLKLVMQGGIYEYPISDGVFSSIRNQLDQEELNSDFARNKNVLTFQTLNNKELLVNIERLKSLDVIYLLDQNPPTMFHPVIYFLIDEIQEDWDQMGPVGEELLQGLTEQRLAGMSDEEYVKVSFFQKFNCLDEQTQDAMMEHESQFHVRGDEQSGSYLLDDTTAEDLEMARMSIDMGQRLRFIEVQHWEEGPFRMINFQHSDLIEIPQVRYDRILAENSDAEPPVPEIPSKEMTDLIGGPILVGQSGSGADNQEPEDAKIIQFSNVYQKNKDKD